MNRAIEEVRSEWEGQLAGERGTWLVMPSADTYERTIPLTAALVSLLSADDPEPRTGIDENGNGFGSSEWNVWRTRQALRDEAMRLIGADK